MNQFFGALGPQMVAQLIAIASAAGVRTSLTLLGLGAAGRFEWVVLPEQFAWIGTDAGLSLLLALVVFEEIVESNEDLQAITEHANYALRGLGGAMVAMALERTGMTESMPAAVPAVLGAGISIGTHHLRMRLHGVLRGLGDDLTSPRRWLTILETGGTLGLIVAVFLAPFLALAFVIAAASASALAIVVRRAGEDRLFRRSCPHCGYRARKEASRCAGCRRPIGVERWL